MIATGPPGDVGQAEFLVRITVVIATAVRHHAPVVTSDLTRLADSIGIKIQLCPT